MREFMHEFMHDHAVQSSLSVLLCVPCAVRCVFFTYEPFSTTIRQGKTWQPACKLPTGMIITKPAMSIPVGSLRASCHILLRMLHCADPLEENYTSERPGPI